MKSFICAMACLGLLICSDICFGGVEILTIALKQGSISVKSGEIIKAAENIPFDTVKHSNVKRLLTKDDVQRIADEMGLMKETSLNPHLRFLAGDIAYWYEQKLSETSLRLQFVARKLVLEAADVQGIVINDQGELSFAAQKLLPNLQKERILFSKPSITLSEEVFDEDGNTINLKTAPFKIRVQGKITNSQKYFTYLIVNDYNADWVEPTGGLGAGVNQDFSGYCYLGQKDTTGSLKDYQVFAVVTNKEYNEYQKLDKKTIIISSKKLQLRRTK